MNKFFIVLMVLIISFQTVAVEVGSWKVYEAEKATAWKIYDGDRIAAWKIYDAAELEELNKLRSADQVVYLQWIDAKARRMDVVQNGLEKSNKALQAYVKAVMVLDEKYKASHQAAYARYKAAERTVTQKK